MCRSIHTLFNFDPPATAEEIEAAALQYVRKIAGFTRPSRANEAAFSAAVAEITEATARLVATLTTSAAPRDRDAFAAAARARAARRDG
ncbi:MAG: DUF2277 domain-containing protein [bacterium]